MATSSATGDRASSVRPHPGPFPVDKPLTRQATDNRNARRRYVTAKERNELPAVYECMLGPKLAELAAAGRAYAFPLLGRKFDRQALPPGAKWALAPRHIAALSWVVTGQLVYRTRGLIISHNTMGGLLVGLGRKGAPLGERWTGQTMRELVAWGFLTSQPWTTDGVGVRVLRLSNLYRLTRFAVAFFDLDALFFRGREDSAKQARLRREGAGKESGGRTAVVTVPDASSAGLEAAGRVKDSSAAQPGSPRGGCVQPPIVRVRCSSTLSKRVEELAARRLREVEEQARGLARGFVELARRERGEPAAMPAAEPEPETLEAYKARLARERAEGLGGRGRRGPT